MEKTDKNNFETKVSGELKKRPVAHFRLSLGDKQMDFIYRLLGRTKLRIGQLVLQSIQYVDNNETDLTSFLNEYIYFINDKTHGIGMGIQKMGASHENLKKASAVYKSVGYNIGIKGVVLLYLLYYAKNYLNMDITKYKLQM